MSSSTSALKLIQVGNSVGVILSKEMLSKLRAEKGDTVYVSETPRGLEFSSYDPDFAAEMEVAKGVMKRRRNVLRKLAQ